ncbi:MAG: hypothetical protein Q9205_003592 [Flavoplaca limonia]
MPIMNSRGKNAPRSKVRAQGRSGRKKGKRARVSAEDQVTKRPVQQTEATETSSEKEIELAKFGNRPVNKENPGETLYNKASQHGEPDGDFSMRILKGGADYCSVGVDGPSLLRRPPQEDSEVVADCQVLAMPQATPHPSIHPGVDEIRSQHQHEGTKADGHTVPYEAKKNLTVQNSLKATKAVKKAKARLDKAKKIKEVEVEKAFMTSEARVNHAMVVMEASKTRIARIVESGSVMVGEAIKTGDNKISRARETLQTAKYKKNQANEAMREALIMLRASSDKRGDTHDAGDVDSSEDDAD